MTRSVLRRLTPAVAIASALVLAACGGQGGGSGGGEGGGVAGPVLIDGSSTVEPLSSAAAELFQQQNPGVNVTVATSGTGGGFEKFCSGQTDISNASRAIEDDERMACQQAGIEFVELQVANDALTVVVNQQNNWAQCLTTQQLATMWAPQSAGVVTNWQQVNPAFPPEPLALFGPGTDSGTFDFFTEAINGEEGASRPDYQASEDDNVLVQGVQGARGATSYFGFTYFEQNQDTLKAVQVDSGQGCVTPSAQAVQDGTYTPLGRPLFIYVAKQAYTSKPQVKAFLDFYAQQVDQIAQAAQFIPLNQQQRGETQQEVSALGA